jgi:predicted RND superfamily exporter protein
VRIAEPGSSGSRLEGELAVRRAAALGAPTIATAGAASAAAMLVLLLSPVPMVRGFGLLLVIGVVVAFLVVLIAGSAALALPDLSVLVPRPLAASLRGAKELLAGPLARGRRALATPGGAGAAALAAPGRAVLPALRGAGEILGLGRLSRRRVGVGAAGAGSSGTGADRSGVGVLLAGLSRRPLAVLGVGLILAAGGWFADAHTAVQSDVTKLVPANMPSLQALDRLEATTGESGELDVLVHGANVASPTTIAWMVKYEQAMVRHFGYSETTGCQAATICPALSLPDLFTSSTSSSSAAAESSAASSLTQAQINTLLAAVPAYFSEAVVNHARTYATLAFGVRLMPLAKQIRVVAYMRDHLDPPAGVTARLAGLPVLAADGDAALSSTSRRLITLVAGLGAVALMLLAIFRRPRRALVPLVPIVLATGWSALIVWLIGIPLNPMSATLGALVIAISTEFSVLLSERFRRQREAGEDLALALANAYRSTGRAVLASGITAIAGFAVLIVSDVTMLRDFGLVTLIDMSVSLLGVLAVLPAVLTLSESGRRGSAGARVGGLRWPRRTPRQRGPGRRQVPA